MFKKYITAKLIRTTNVIIKMYMFCLSNSNMFIYAIILIRICQKLIVTWLRIMTYLSIFSVPINNLIQTASLQNIDICLVGINVNFVLWWHIYQYPSIFSVPSNNRIQTSSLQHIDICLVGIHAHFVLWEYPGFKSRPAFCRLFS